MAPLEKIYQENTLAYFMEASMTKSFKTLAEQLGGNGNENFEDVRIKTEPGVNFRKLFFLRHRRFGQIS
jgi:hypothetical protein